MVPGPNRGLPQRTPQPAGAGGAAGAKRGSPPGGNQPNYQQVSFNATRSPVKSCASHQRQELCLSAQHAVALCVIRSLCCAL